jgi:xanthine dehydrogenase accessory factor
VLFSDHLVVVRGGGDLATGAVVRLQRAGFPVIVLELDRPLTIRRTVAVSTAVIEGRVFVEEVEAVRVDTTAQAVEVARTGLVPVLVGSTLPELPAAIAVVVDGRLAKRNIDTTMADAPLVIALGPGFEAGVDCHAVIETMRGHHLGRVIWDGPASPDTGVPGVIGGESSARIVRAPLAGRLTWRVAISDEVAAGEELGDVAGRDIRSKIGGVVRGLLVAGDVEEGLKIADIDPRADPSVCFEVSDKSSAVGGGVLEAVLAHLNAQAS